MVNKSRKTVKTVSKELKEEKNQNNVEKLVELYCSGNNGTDNQLLGINIESEFDKSDLNSIINLPLKRLNTKGFYPEQIWHQMDLNNQKILSDLTSMEDGGIKESYCDDSSDANELTLSQEYESLSDISISEVSAEESSNDADDHYSKSGHSLESDDDDDSNNGHTNDEFEDYSDSEHVNDDGFEKDEKEPISSKKSRKRQKLSTLENDDEESSAKKSKDKFFNEEEMLNFMDQEDNLYKEDDDMEMLYDEGFEYEDSQSGDDLIEQDNRRFSDINRRIFDEDISASENEDDEEEQAYLIKSEKKQKAGQVESNDTNSDADVETDATDESDEDESTLTAYEIEQKRLSKQIAALEKQNLSNKSWKMSGEARASERPKSSLLEENMSFIYGRIAPPVITEKVTKKIEDMLRVRIRDNIWDDVERRKNPQIDAAVYRLPAVVDSTKSEKGLADVYHEDYLRKAAQKNDSETNKSINPVNSQLEKQKPSSSNDPNHPHNQIQKMLDSVFILIDELCNSSNSVKTPTVEIKVLTNHPTAAIEEPGLVAINTNTTLAPEEMHAKKQKLVVDKSELTKVEKARLRKNAKAKKQKSEVIKKTFTPSTSVKKETKSKKKAAKKSTDITSVKTSSSTKNYSSSTQFFDSLQQINNS